MRVHLTAHDIRGAAEELAATLFGRSPLGRAATRIVGAFAFNQAGGHRLQQASPKQKVNKPKANRRQPPNKVIKLADGVEYFPPTKEKRK